MMDPQLPVAGYLRYLQSTMAEDHQAPSNNPDLVCRKHEVQKDHKHENGHDSNSNNLRQEDRRVQQVSLSRSASQETAPSFTSSTKKAPIRAVFEDLPTAYLSITSGLAKSRSQTGSSSLLDASLEDSVVSYNSSAAPNDHHEPHEEQGAKSARKVPIYSESEEALPISIVSLRKPLISTSVDVINEQSSLDAPATSPEQSSSIFATDNAQEPLHRRSSSATINKDRLALKSQSTGLRRKSDHAIWAAEESTVGNIYRHYADSSLFHGDSEHYPAREDTNSASPEHLPIKNPLVFSQSDVQEKPTALDVRKQRRADRLTSGPQSRPPSYGLPVLPTLSFSRLPSNKSHDPDRPSSYGDTRNLLEAAQESDLAVPKPTLSRSEGRTDLRLQRPVSEFEDGTDRSLIIGNSNNPFRRRQAAASRDSYIGGAHCDEENQIVRAYRQPLEREVSDALRRASGFSTFSNGSASTSLLKDELFEHEVSNYRDTPVSKGTKINHGSRSEGRSSNSSTYKKIPPTQRFYNERAIPVSWITPNQENVVRVPINREAGCSDPSTKAFLIQHNTLEDRNDGVNDDFEGDSNDWETVGESRFGAEVKGSQYNDGVFGASTIRRTGSSLANTSNDGTISLYDTDIDDYGSTERITNHPGAIQYSSDYRLQDLNQTPTPIFPPIYREHKVNGYLADLARHRGPSSPFNLALQPLESRHSNPFRSRPPEDLSTPTARRTLFQKRIRRGRRPNHFPPSTQTSDTAEGDGAVEQSTDSISSSLTLATLSARERTFQTLDQNEELSYPSPTLSYSKRQFLSPINPVGRPDRPSSWRHLMTFGRGDKIEGYNEDGTLDETSSTIELRNLSYHKRSVSSREHKPLVCGPPGAFYQGIACSHRDSDSISSFGTHRRSSKPMPLSNDHPTNALRPLSLLENGSLTPVVDGRRGRQHIRSSSGRVYRSPHAPPRRLSWQQLYTEAQLQTMQEAATADTSLASNTRTSGQNTRNGSTYRAPYTRTGFNHRLGSWTRETSARMDLRDRNKRFSVLVLMVCAVFPPLLVLFALGRLDRVMAWWSKGTLTAFEDKHKKSALILISVWGFAFFVGLIIILVFRYASPTSPPSS